MRPRRGTRGHRLRTSLGATAAGHGLRRARGASRQLRRHRGRLLWRDSTAPSQHADPEDREDLVRLPAPSGRLRLPQVRRGSVPRCSRVLIREVPVEDSVSVLQEETREFRPGLVLGPDGAADPGGPQPFRRSNDGPGDPLQESVSLVEREGQFAARAAPRQLAGHREARGPNDQEGDEAADDEEVRETDLVELAVVPEPRDEDEGQEEEERAPDREGANASVIAPTFATISSRCSRPRLRSRIGSASETVVALSPSEATCSRRLPAVCPKVT